MNKGKTEVLESLSRLQAQAATRLREVWEHQQELGLLARDFVAEAGSLRQRVDELEQRLKKIQEQNQDTAGTLRGIAEHNDSLAQLYVASTRLSEVLDRDEVVGSIREIVANFIGSEEVAIYEYRGGSELALIGAEGIDRERMAELPLRGHVLGELVRGGQLFVSDSEAAPEGFAQLNACIPLHCRGRLVGAVLVFGLLKQKPALGPVDRELCELLGSQAAAALYRAQTYERLREAAPASVGEPA